MNKRKKFGIMVIMAKASIWSAITMTTVCALTDHFGGADTYSIPWINLTFSRWWDVLFLPVCVNIILGLFFFENRHRIDSEDYKFGFLLQFLFGLVLVFWFGFGVGLMVGFIWLIKKITKLQMLKIKSPT